MEANVWDHILICRQPMLKQIIAAMSYSLSKHLKELWHFGTFDNLHIHILQVPNLYAYSYTPTPEMVML